MPKLPMSPTGAEPQAEGEARDRLAPEAMVRRGVLAVLGKPPGLYEVAVRPLWGNHFRVNVLIGPDSTAVRIAHSFFVEAGTAGDIVSATPRITKLYA